MAVYDIPSILVWEKISQYLAEAYGAQDRLFKGRNLDPYYTNLIFMESELLEFMYVFNPTEENIDAVANYNYALIKYLAQAKVIAGAGGTGGIVIPGTGTAATILAINLEFEMGVTASPKVINGVNVTLPTAGSNSITLPLSNIMANSLQVFRDGVSIPSEASTLSQYCTISYSTTQAVITLQTLGNTFENSQFWQIIGSQYQAT